MNTFVFFNTAMRYRDPEILYLVALIPHSYVYMIVIAVCPDTV